MSPVHDQSYRRYQGARSPLGRAWLVIAGSGIRALLSRKVFLALLALAWVPFLVRTVQIYAVTMYPQARQLLPVDAAMFQRFVEGQGVFAFFIAVYVGAGLIANDRRANALPVYLSKPLRRVEYIGGKLAILLGCLFAVTLVPALVLVAMQVIFSASFALLRDNPGLVPAVIVTTAIRSVVAAATMLALSAMSKSARYVAVLYTGVIFFAQAMYGVLAFVTGSSRVAWVSISANFDIVTDAIFQHAPRYETPVAVSALVLVCLVVVSCSVLERQVRGVEIVS